MDDSLRELLEKRIPQTEEGLPSKVMSISEAVRRFIKPGQSLQTGSGMAFPTALFGEIGRQFWGKKPDFTLISMTGGSITFAIFVHGGLCRKIISTYNGDSVPFPLPNPILAKAYQEKTVLFEDWTMLTYVQRLMAGALGLPFFPTKSIKGSSIADENQGTFETISDPFGGDESVGVVKALNPDVSLVHAWAADPDGNTIISPAYAGHAWGPLAAKEGVIVTAEKIVSRDFIRKYNHLVKIPSYAVGAVCQARMGGHPGGLYPMGLPEFMGYGEDMEFIFESRQASRSPEDYQAWIDKWILDVRDHEEYLDNLGHERIWYLKGRIHDDAWRSEFSDLCKNLDQPAGPNPSETLVAGAVAKLKEIILEKGHQTMLCGLGVSNLAAWIAYYDLLNQGTKINLIAELGFYNYSPLPGDPWIFNIRNIPTCSMTSDIFTIMGVALSGSGARSLAVLGAGQVDRQGNVNTTKMPELDMYLVGSGGGNDAASGASEVVIALEQNAFRFVDKISYVTSPGDRVTTVISQLGVYEKSYGKGDLVLTGYYPQDGKTEQECVQEIKAQCGWDLAIAPSLRVYPEPTLEDLKFMRCFDPRRLFIGGKGESRRNPFARDK